MCNSLCGEYDCVCLCVCVCVCVCARVYVCARARLRALVCVCGSVADWQCVHSYGYVWLCACC